MIEKQLQRPSKLMKTITEWANHNSKAQNMDLAESTGAVLKIHLVPDKITMCEAFTNYPGTNLNEPIIAQSKYMKPA